MKLLKRKRAWRRREGKEKRIEFGLALHPEAKTTRERGRVTNQSTHNSGIWESKGHIHRSIAPPHLIASIPLVLILLLLFGIPPWLEGVEWGFDSIYGAERGRRRSRSALPHLDE